MTIPSTIPEDFLMTIGNILAVSNCIRDPSFHPAENNSYLSVFQKGKTTILFPVYRQSTFRFLTQTKFIDDFLCAEPSTYHSPGPARHSSLQPSCVWR